VFALKNRNAVYLRKNKVCVSVVIFHGIHFQ
jgi:hypothetical protein